MGVDVGNEEERRALEGGRQVVQENGCVAHMHHARSDIEAAKGENQQQKQRQGELPPPAALFPRRPLFCRHALPRFLPPRPACEAFATFLREKSFFCPISNTADVETRAAIYYNRNSFNLQGLL